jgi:hypothetical protein
LLSLFIPDIAPEVEIQVTPLALFSLTLHLPLSLQLGRNEYLNGKVIDNIEDEDDDDGSPRGLSAKANYAVL